MPDAHLPRPVQQVMVSSTFTDLEEHRKALITALREYKLYANVMENDSAKAAGDVIDSSLQMVRDSAAYILLIGHRYGQTPTDAARNPGRLSVTELEFNEAVQRGRPTLLFIMSDDHPVKKGDVERERGKERKLNAFRKRAKLASPGGMVNRVYAVFDSLEEFQKKIGPALTDLRRVLDEQALPPETIPLTSALPATAATPDPEAIPTAPALYAEPRYIGSHLFVGRDAQLQDLSDWAKPADPTTLLLFEAIGGNGKSMLTWEWVTNHAPAARPAEAPWAGRFWYSFYERGAVMSDFCRRALAYTTGRPLKEFARKKTTELAEQLLAQLTARPWLFILDGLERVLVAYHRIDAAEVPDEEASAPTDKIANRDPRDAIREEDNDLLRALAAVRPSKILVSSRLTPRVLLNQAQQPISGVKRIDLPGLRPADAEALLKSCGVTGDSTAIQQYLMENCDNHPLVVGVLAGLINKPGPCRGNFDAWVADPAAGKSLDLGKLDLIQRRNDILRAAINAVPAAGRQLLATLALISDSVDYATLEALNPHLPPEPEAVEEPESPEAQWDWDTLKKREKAEARRQYEADLARWTVYEEAVRARLASVDYRAAPARLADTVTDLERRGLLQWDGRDRRYNLHPVVRGVAAGGLGVEDRDRYGQRVVDHFSSVVHNPYGLAETLEDLRPGLHVVGTLLKLGRIEQAADAYLGDLSRAMLYNVECHSEQLALLKPFFGKTWAEMSDDVDIETGTTLLSYACESLEALGFLDEALQTHTIRLRHDLVTKSWTDAMDAVSRLASTFMFKGGLSRYDRLVLLALELFENHQDSVCRFLVLLGHFEQLSVTGRFDEASAVWEKLDPLGRSWPRNYYLAGEAETKHALSCFWQGKLEEGHLISAHKLAENAHSRSILRNLHRLRGAWRLEQGEWALAAASFGEAVRMARERGLPDSVSETGFALARHQIGLLPEPQREAERLAQLCHPADRYLAMLWQAISDLDQAKRHAVAAYKWAWADGEPYVYRYELTKATKLLWELGAPVPDLPPYDSAKNPPAPWEADIRAAIDKLRAEKKAEAKAKKRK